MNEDIRAQLKSAFISVYQSDECRLKSKTEIIREMYDDIQEARDNGVKVSLLVQILNSKGYTIKEGEFCQILHRIRKKKMGVTRNKNTSKTNNKITNKKIKSTESEGQRIAKPHQDKVDKYMALHKGDASISERYAALGGDLDDLKGLNEREQRKKCIKLLMKITDHIEKIEKTIR